MGTIDQRIEALEFEREGYVTFDKKDRVADVDAELKHWRAERCKHGGKSDAETLSPTQRKRAVADGVITEAEAANDPAADGEAASNERAAAHAKQKAGANDTPIITEAEVAAEQEDPQERANDLAEEHASEEEPTGPDPAIITEAEAVAEARAAEDDEEPTGAKPKPKRTTANSKPRTTR